MARVRGSNVLPPEEEKRTILSRVRGSNVPTKARPSPAPAQSAREKGFDKASPISPGSKTVSLKRKRRQRILDLGPSTVRTPTILGG